MTDTNANERIRYVVPFQELGKPSKNDRSAQGIPLVDPVLLWENVTWFCRLRWIVASALIVFGIIGFFPGIGQAIQLNLRPSWLLSAGGILIVGNIIFLRLARKGGGAHAARTNLWIQIVFDLLVLTAAVHFLGSLNTYAPFGYLFHTVLACIFFTRLKSLLVTTLASLMYTTLVILESTDILPSAGVFVRTQDLTTVYSSWDIAVHICSAASIWFIVWYLVARLSDKIRHREEALNFANHRLDAANSERVRHMLHTTHELKAPFSAIYANIQLLERGSFGEMPDKAVDVLNRISKRCKGLSKEITEMLQLANLESTVQDGPPLREVDLKDIIESSLERIGLSMEVRSINVDKDLQSAPVKAVEDHMVMLFENLLSNAASYSNEGGTVLVQCRPVGEGGAVVVIEDEGIGIEETKLPKIFEAYYRTGRAAKHYEGSTGLGLTIVRHVAQAHGIGIEIDSALGKGTKFTITVPHTPGIDNS